MRGFSSRRRHRQTAITSEYAKQSTVSTVYRRLRHRLLLRPGGTESFPDFTLLVAILLHRVRASLGRDSIRPGYGGMYSGRKRQKCVDCSFLVVASILDGRRRAVSDAFYDERKRRREKVIDNRSSSEDEEDEEDEDEDDEEDNDDYESSVSSNVCAYVAVRFVNVYLVTRSKLSWLEYFKIF